MHACAPLAFPNCLQKTSSKLRGGMVMEVMSVLQLLVAARNSAVLTHPITGGCCVVPDHLAVAGPQLGRCQRRRVLRRIKRGLRRYVGLGLG
jgi:hypothetical protein